MTARAGAFGETGAICETPSRSRITFMEDEEEGGGRRKRRKRRGRRGVKRDGEGESRMEYRPTIVDNAATNFAAVVYHSVIPTLRQFIISYRSGDRCLPRCSCKAVPFYNRKESAAFVSQSRAPDFSFRAHRPRFSKCQPQMPAHRIGWAAALITDHTLREPFAETICNRCKMTDCREKSIV